MCKYCIESGTLFFFYRESIKSINSTILIRFRANRGVVFGRAGTVILFYTWGSEGEGGRKMLEKVEDAVLVSVSWKRRLW